MAREDTISQFLQSTEWAEADRAPLAGDASMRKYQRLGESRHGVHAVLMDADPALGNDVRPFVKITNYLRGLGLSAPEIYAQDDDAGILVLEDLGDDLFARVLEADATNEDQLYRAATDVLVALHQAEAPELDLYDTGLMTKMVALSFDWYQLGGTGQLNHDARTAFVEAFSRLLDTEVAAPSILIQRDYHAENLLWLPERDGLARVGLLDYQDALLGHPAYDLVSLLKDARRDVPADVEDAMIQHYVARSGCDGVEFRRAYHVLGLQRNLRILGVFARLSMHFGKPSYVDLIPRVWDHVQTDLAEPVNQPVADILRRYLPAPSPEILQELRNKCGTVPTL